MIGNKVVSCVILTLGIRSRYNGRRPYYLLPTFTQVHRPTTNFQLLLMLTKFDWVWSARARAHTHSYTALLLLLPGIQGYCNLGRFKKYIEQYIHNVYNYIS